MITNAKYGQCASGTTAAVKLPVDSSLLEFLGIVRAVVGTTKFVQVVRVRARELLILYAARTGDHRLDPEAFLYEVDLIFQREILSKADLSTSGNVLIS